MIQNKSISIVLFSFVLFLINGCGNTKNKQVDDFQEKNVNVIIKVTKTNSYCGGARPTPEIEMEHRKKKVYADATIYIRKGELNNYEEEPYAIIHSDSSGIVNIFLPEGKYVFVFENKANQKTYDDLLKMIKESSEYRNLNEECLKRYFKKPEGLLDVSLERIDSISINRHINCPWSSVPCAQFTGNLPPNSRE